MTDIISVEVDRRLCVLCAGPNDCVMAKREAGEEAEDPCWCVAQSFPDALTKKANKVDSSDPDGQAKGANEVVSSVPDG